MNRLTRGVNSESVAPFFGSLNHFSGAFLLGFL